jgi:hypothetical protein
VGHYHIRWSESKLDWDIFDTPEEAEAAAKQLVLPNETYTIEQFDGDCPRCNDTSSPGRPDSGGAIETAPFTGS